MKWSWKISDISGIGIYIHSTFFILLAWIGVSYWLSDQTLSAVARGVGFIVAIFACVLLHELGHALAAQRFGISTKDITLLPIGGVARLERMPDEPKQELVVALAGPLVNVVIAVLLWIALSIIGGHVPWESFSVTDGPFFNRLMLVNLMLVVFNLLPAFPMDGGRVLRALFATQMDYTKATQIAANVGQLMALIFGFVGLFSNPFLVFIALFVWIGAAQEAGMVQIKSAISGVPVRGAMVTDYQVVRPEDSLEHAVQLTLAGSQKDFPVLKGADVAGILTQAELLSTLSERGPATLVQETMQERVEFADADEMLEDALARLENCDCRTLLVRQRGRLVGLVTRDNVQEFLRIQAAIDAAKRSNPSTEIEGRTRM